MTTAMIVRRSLVVAALAALSARTAWAACPAFSQPDLQRNSVLRISGPPSRQSLALTLSPSAAVLSLDCNGDGDFLDADLGDVNNVEQGSFDVVELEMGGSDTIAINLQGDFSGVAKTVRVRLGPGTNVVNLGSVGAVTFGAGSRMLLDLVGGAGTDRATLNFSAFAVMASTIEARADLGAGNDVLRLSAPALSADSAFDFDAALGPGANAFAYAEGATAGSVRVDVQGDSGPDAVALTFQQPATGSYTVDLGAGNDSFAASFDLPSFVLLPARPLHLAVQGGAGNDTIEVGRGGTTGTAFALNVLELLLNGGAGDDRITVDFGGGGLDFEALGGERLRVDGGAGRDTIAVTLDGATALGPVVHDISISGGAQADSIRFAQTTIGPDHSWKGGAALVDGGFDGPDVCALGGASAANAHLRNCER